MAKKEGVCSAYLYVQTKQFHSLCLALVVALVVSYPDLPKCEFWC